MQNVYATVTMPSIFYIHFSLIFFLHLNSFCHFCRLKYTHALQTLAAHVNRIDLETSSWASLNFMQCEQVQKETEYWFTLLVSCLSLFVVAFLNQVIWIVTWECTELTATIWWQHDTGKYRGHQTMRWLIRSNITQRSIHQHHQFRVRKNCNDYTRKQLSTVQNLRLKQLVV